jgi:hypothetical protein
MNRREFVKSALATSALAIGAYKASDVSDLTNLISGLYKLPRIPPVAAPAQMPAIPPSPVPGYIWLNSGTSFYNVTYLGVTYPAGLVMGAYVPANISLDKRYDLYLYVRRSPAITLGVSPLTNVILGAALGVGLGLTGAGKGVFLRFSLYVKDQEWQAQTWLVYPYDPPETYLTYDPPEIPVYRSVGDVPTEIWAGPFNGSAKVSISQPFL